MPGGHGELEREARRLASLAVVDLLGLARLFEQLLEPTGQELLGLVHQADLDHLERCFAG